MVLAVPFAVAKALVTSAARIVFRRIVPLGDVFPRDGPVLVVANHPAAWTDAVVLDVALRRKLHFIVWDQMFHPRARGLLLELFGSLPVHFGQADLEPTTNRETFERCLGLLARGHVVAIFPEGVSLGDRTIAPLKPGAARLALEAAGSGIALRVIPVALHYEDRVAFRRDVRVVVGAPIAIPPGDVSEGTATLLTTTMDAHLRALLETGGRDARRATISRSRGPVMEGILFAAGVIGTIVHAIPAIVIETVARRFAAAPQQTLLARLAGGFVVLPLWYLALGVIAWNAGLGAITILVPLFGMAACRLVDRRHDRMRMGA